MNAINFGQKIFLLESRCDPSRCDLHRRMGAGMAYMHSLGVTYGDLAMFDVFRVILLGLNSVNVVFVLRYFGWRGVGFGVLRWGQLVRRLPIAALLAVK